MAKKIYEKLAAMKEIKEVNEVLDKAIIDKNGVNKEETIEMKPLLEESLVIDTDKLSKELNEMKKEIFEEKSEVEESKIVKAKEEKNKVEPIKKEEPKVKQEKETPKVEEVKEKTNKNKTFVNRVFGLMWNGQEYDY